MATDLGSDYMELVRRTFVPRRSGDLQLLLAPYNSSNYPQESLSLVPRDPRTSHASPWMYLERIPLLVHAPSLVVASDSDERVTLADLAPTSVPTDRVRRLARRPRRTTTAARDDLAPHDAPR